MVELNTFITIIYETVAAYYELRSLVSGMKRQEIEHLVKSLVLQGPAYVFIFNIMSLSQHQQIKKLEQVMLNRKLTLK